MTPSPLSVYRRLLSAYGPQGWWPVTPIGGRIPVYRNRRGVLTERERAEICVGTVLAQNTNWGNAQRALVALHEAGLWELRRIAQAPMSRLESLIRPSGYFRQKARKLKALAGHFLKRGVGLSERLSEPLAELRSELLGLWGVGPETADSILLYAGGRSSFVVDAYTIRIGKRLGWFRRAPSYAQAQEYLVRRLPAEPSLYGEFHALLVALAKAHCLSRRPLCGHCPLLAGCRYGRARGRAGNS